MNAVDAGEAGQLPPHGMGTGTDADPQLIRRDFLCAVEYAQPAQAKRLADLLDWSLLSAHDVRDNPVFHALQPDLWKGLNQSSFIARKRNEVAEAAFEAFNFDGYTVEDAGGWNIGSDGRDREFRYRSVFVRPIDAPIDTPIDQPTTKLILSLIFRSVGCRIDEIGCSDLDGNVVGFLPDIDAIGGQNHIGLQPKDMPALLKNVLRWCLQHGRADLIAPASGKPTGQDTYQSRFLYRAVQEGQIDAAFLMIEQGSDPHEMFEVDETADAVDAGIAANGAKTRLSLLDLMERELDVCLVSQLRSYVSRRQAQKALDEIGRLVDKIDDKVDKVDMAPSRAASAASAARVTP